MHSCFSRCKPGMQHFARGRNGCPHLPCGRRWPAAFSNLVCLLPKGGSADPDDRRPVVLLSVIYRIWAAARAVPLRRWLRRHGLLLRGEAGAPDVKAGDLALPLNDTQGFSPFLFWVVGRVFQLGGEGLVCCRGDRHIALARARMMRRNTMPGQSTPSNRPV